MNRQELAKDFIQTAATIINSASTVFAASILKVDQITYKPSRDIQKVIVKLAYRLADEFIEQSKYESNK